MAVTTWVAETAVTLTTPFPVPTVTSPRRVNCPVTDTSHAISFVLPVLSWVRVTTRPEPTGATASWVIGPAAMLPSRRTEPPASTNQSISSSVPFCAFTAVTTLVAPRARLGIERPATAKAAVCPVEALPRLVNLPSAVTSKAVTCRLLLLSVLTVTIRSSFTVAAATRVTAPSVSVPRRTRVLLTASDGASGTKARSGASNSAALLVRCIAVPFTPSGSWITPLWAGNAGPQLHGDRRPALFCTGSNSRRFSSGAKQFSLRAKMHGRQSSGRGPHRKAGGRRAGGPWAGRIYRRAGGTLSRSARQPSPQPLR